MISGSDDQYMMSDGDDKDCDDDDNDDVGD